MQVQSDVLRRLNLFESVLRGTLEVARDEITLAMYSTDASMYQITPLAVCYPRSPRDVGRIVEVAASLGLPVLPRGGASSLAGQTVGEAVVLDFTRHMQRIVSIDVEAQTATVEPGVVLDNLNRKLAVHGLMVGPDPASANRATLGGMVGNNATGTHSIVYGNVERHIVSIDAVLADGTLVTFGESDDVSWAAGLGSPGLFGEIHRGIDSIVSGHSDVIRRDTPRHWRRNSGYRLESMLEPKRNIARLVCGSEGTLAVVTQITIKLVERPAHTSLGIVHFHTRDAALRAVTRILETRPTAVELLDGVAIRQCRAMPAFAARMGFVEGDPGAVLITEYSGGTSESVVAQLDRLSALSDTGDIGYSIVRRTHPREVDDVWSVRKEALGLVMGIKGNLKPMAFIEDASVPVEHLADYIRQLDEFIQSTDTPVAYYAHASAGCLHVRPFVDTKSAREVDKMMRISRKSMELVRSFGGSVSSEHGDGLARSWLNRDILGTELYELNRRLKQCFDPANLLNPGKVVDAPRMDESLRFGSGYKTASVQSRLDFSFDGGFSGAVELCSGMGTCRKTTTGTMCPSFMATNAEKDSTRGRANALRAALSGQMPADMLYSDSMHDVMDLCIQCKACKTECPAGVDMAAIKSEWLYQYHKSHGGWYPRALRDKIFARMPELARRLSGPLASFVNAVNRNPVARFGMHRLLGIERTRPLPEFSRESFQASLANELSGLQMESSSSPTVVLFADTFNNYNDPHIARSAYDLLRQIGYHVVVPSSPVCCGRTRFSKGDLDGARKTVAEALAVLRPYADAGYPIVGLEPSCIQTFGDEAIRLFPDDDNMSAAASAVADAAISFERFVSEDRDGLFGGASWQAVDGPVLLHGHCHQKSLEGMAHSAGALKYLGADVKVLDTSCCGMAGSFGYEVEHAASSRLMAERVLAPSVRALDGAGIVVASGSSCRAQIADLAGRRALHPAEVLLRAARGSTG